MKIEDEWQREATASAVASARAVVSGGALSGRAQLATLSEIEWGWICCAAIFGWIEVKARQAACEGQDVEVAIRSMPDREIAPWDYGAVASVLPRLADIEGLPWDLPPGAWTKRQMISFAWRTHCEVAAALSAREAGATDKIVRFTREIAEREHSAAHGGPLMTHEEREEEIPF